MVSQVEEFFSKYGKRSPLSEAMSASLVNQFLLLMADEEIAQIDPEGNGLVGQIIAYLNRHIGERLSIEQTAKRFFISKYYLCRLFKKHTGVTVLAYINSKRMAKAHQLISEGEPPTEVAYSLGFSDYSSFYRAYVKEIGKSPSNAAKKDATQTR